MNFELKEFLKELKDPSAIMRTAPLWVWNDTMTDTQIDHALDELKSHGFGGAIVHPRPGMVLTYLSQEWFTQWGYALKAAIKRGMKLYIYDENSYPSGFGGGHVSAELPDCLGTSVGYQLVHRDQIFTKAKKEVWFDNSNRIKVFACEKMADDKIKLIQDITYLPKEQWGELAEWFVMMNFVKAETTGWMAGFANVDLLRREVTDTFIEKVYQPYYEHFGDEFGKAIPAIFMDEPAITGSGVYGTAGTDVLPYSYWFSHEFYKRNGYHLEDYLPALFADVKAIWFEHSDKKVRHDYYDTTRELWVNNFMVPLSKWCEEHKVALTGHFMEDDWPRASAGTTSPNIMANFEFMGWPAIDMLVNDKLLKNPNEHVGLIMQELRSAVNQFGQERCFCEAFGAGGWDSSLADFKRVGDWLMVNGVNFINEHLTYTSYTGARKRDHPQSFDWRQPWWDQFTGVNDYFGRVCALLSQGKMEQRVLLMHPTTTGYLRIMDGEPSGLVVNDNLSLTPDMRPYYEAMQQMIDDQWDFDLGNEDIMKRHGKVADCRLQIKNQEYQVVAITKDMKNMFSSTITLLQEYMDAGGHVVSLGIPGGYVDGEKDTKKIGRLLAHRNWMTVDTPKQLSQEIAKYVVNRMETSKPFATGVEHMRRKLDEEWSVYYFVNHSLGAEENTVTIAGRDMMYLDLWDGSTKNYKFEEKDGKLTFELSLERYESAMFLIHRKDTGAVKNSLECYMRPNIPGSREKEAILTVIEPESLNSMVIDYCDLELDGKKYEDMCALFAGKELFRHRGFSDNPWDNQVQYKRRYLDSNHFLEGTGFTASYKFMVKEIPDRAELVVEQGERFEVTVNGRTVLWKEGYYLDELNRICDIGDFLREGENIVVLKNSTFDVRLELEPVYIRGNFAVEEENGKWTIKKPDRLSYGTWINQGYPMYEGAVLYRYLFQNKGEKEVLVSVAPMETTCASLFINNKEIGLIGVNGNYLFDITKHCTEGENTVEVRVCSSFKNLIGPHHCSTKPRRSAWPDMWRQSPRFGRPAPGEYDLISYGMNEGIRIFVK